MGKMDKYEFNVRVEQIKKLVNRGDYESAMKIADTIDWRRVRNVSILSMVSSIYEKNEEYQEAKDILLLAFERAPIGKRLLYKLAELAVKQGNMPEAEDYYREFCDLAPEDARQYLLRYMILKAKGAPAEQLIHTLEQYCNIELDEKWMYELATLYSQTGMSDLCVRTCDKIMLMFGLGKYVEKAMDLKIQYAPLTKYQMDLEENRDKYEARLREVEQGYEGGGFDLESQKPGWPERARRVDPSKAQETFEEEASVYGERQPYRFYSRPDQEENTQAQTAAAAQAKNAAAYEAAVTQVEPAAAAAQMEPVAAAAAQVGTADVSEAAVTQAESTAVQESAVAQMGTAAVQESAVAQMESAAPQEAVAQPETSDQTYAAAQPEDYSAAAGVQTASSQTAAAWRQSPQTEEDLAARVHEAEVQANLARELSRISGAEFSEESRYAQTRVLKDIRSLKVNGENVPAAGGPSNRVASHLMVEAEEPEAGLVIAVDALKQIHRQLGIKNQAAKITGEKLNTRGVLALADKLVGKDLIVEYAGDMTDEVLEELDQLMDRDETGMNVILIDNKEQLDAIKEEYPGLAKRFRCIDEHTRELFPAQVHAQAQSAPAVKTQNQAAASSQLRQSGENAAQRPPQPAPVQTEVRQSQAAPAGQEEIRPSQPAPVREEARQDRPAQPESRPEPPRQRSAQPPQPQFEEEEYEEEDQYQPEEEMEEEYDSPYRQQPEAEEADDEEEMDIDEFAQYACQYAGEIDCSISGKSMLALYERIEIMEEDGIPLTRANAEELIEEAADRAERPGLGKRMKGLFSSKYDKEGRLVLKEEHFI